MADVNEVLVLLKGSTKPFDIFIFNQDDQPEVLSAFDAATFSIREEESGPDIVLLRTADVNLAIDTANAKLTGTLSQPQADALKVGPMVGDVALRETSSGKWFHLDRIRVRVLNGFAPHTT